MVGFDFEAFGEKLKAEIAEQTITIMREMMAEFIREERQAPPPPQPRPFDLDIENLGRQQVDDDQ